ncbi:MAG: thiamine-phosphate kinase [Hahellaceae bacterium]|nr:thiamine-phosphate kinase [Hahellaceae bacterium]MCP5168851.1 thiamine-phosphate kinase [Hahellaceae bacterium]
MDEFALIKRYFSDIGAIPELPALAQAIQEGIGNDCAILRIPPQFDLCLSIDTLVSGIHFLPDAPADRLAYRALAVNLSDLAAMGAQPLCFTLALTLPESNELWLQAFSRGLDRAARQYAIRLVGGDTTRGPLSITIQVQGVVTAGQGLRRSGAQKGDLICVTGVLGDANAALGILGKGNPAEWESYFLSRYYEPSPRLREGLALSGLATACIDVSDGLLADLAHILESSGCGAVIRDDAIPLSEALRGTAINPLTHALEGGDDYELCFTISESNLALLRDREPTLRFTEIGSIVSTPGLRRLNHRGEIMCINPVGYKHF